MQLSDLVPALDTCRALKAAGFPEDTVFAWRFGYHDTDPQVWAQDDYTTQRGDHDPAHECVAPTLADLLAALPRCIEDPDGGDYYLGLWRGIKGATAVAYHDGDDGLVLVLDLGTCDQDAEEHHANPAEAAAQLWLALHAAGLLPDSASALVTADTRTAT